MFLQIVFISIMLIYLLIFGYLHGKYPGNKLKGDHNNLDEEVGEVSIIIPFRNEELNIPPLIESLHGQSFKGELQVIFINDHSSDKGSELIEDWIKLQPANFNVQLCHSNKEGKKEALKLGVDQAVHEVILQTDADCILYPDWISRSIIPFQDKNVKASIGVVAMPGEESFWSKFMALEFMALQASGIAMAASGIPVMSNGANLAYRKEVWKEHCNTGVSWASGDDVFFIQSLAIQDSTSVAVNTSSMVHSKVPESLGEFAAQRVRWGSKTGGYPLWQGKAIALLVGLVNMAIVLVFLVALFNPYFRLLWLIAFLSKLAIDFMLLFKHTKKVKDARQRQLLRFIPVVSLIYPFYMLIMAWLIMFTTSKVKWKGRALKV